MKSKFISLAFFSSLIVLMFALIASKPYQSVQETPTPEYTATPTPEPTPTRTPLADFIGTGISPQPSRWSNPVMLSSPDQTGWFSDIFADASGTVHVAWSSVINTGPGRSYDVVLYNKTEDGIHWAGQSDIAAELTKGAVTRPSLYVDSERTLHLAYRSYTIFYENFPAVAVNANSSRAMTELSSPDIGYFSQLAMDSAGILHAIFTQNAFDASCEGCFHIYHRKSSDQGLTWSEQKDITLIPNGTAKPWVIIDQDDNIHVVFETGRGGDLGQVPSPARVAYITSTDQGDTWTQPVDFVPSTDGEGRHITIGMDGNGNLTTAWLGLPENRIYFKTSKDAGKTWSQPMAIPGIIGSWDIYISRLDTFSMATDSAGKIHLVLVGRIDQTETNLSVLELVWNGLNWSEPEIVATLEGFVPEWPRIAISNGNQIHLTWFVRKNSDIWTNHSTNRVWYTHGEVESPALVPVIWPTLTPYTTTIIAVDNSTVVSTAPLATSTPTNLNPVEKEILAYSEKEYLAIAGISLVPVILLVAAIFAVVFYWRQRR